jgi:hypothetical protein
VEIPSGDPRASETFVDPFPSGSFITIDDGRPSSALDDSEDGTTEPFSSSTTETPKSAPALSSVMMSSESRSTISIGRPSSIPRPTRRSRTRHPYPAPESHSRTPYPSSESHSTTTPSWSGDCL